MGSLDSYLPIFFMTVLGIAFASLSFGASKLLAPQRPTSAKQAPYECGIVPTHEPARRFPVRFYLIAMIFVIVDIEIIFIASGFPQRLDFEPEGHADQRGAFVVLGQTVEDLHGRGGEQFVEREQVVRGTGCRRC